MELLEQDATAGPVIIPGGLASPGRDVGYLTGPGGVLAAVSLATGEERWRGGSGYALVATGELVLAMEVVAAAPAGSGAFVIHALDAGSGAPRRTTQVIATPAPAPWQILKTHQQGNTLQLALRAVRTRPSPSQARVGGGTPSAAPAMETPGRPQTPTAMAVSIDLGTGRAAPLPVPIEAPSQIALPPDAASRTLLGDPWGGGTLWIHGDRILALAIDHGRLALHAWHAGTLAPDTSHELLDRVPASLQHLTVCRPADRSHAYVLLCNEAALPDGASAGERCRWLAWDVVSGERAADVPYARRDPGRSPEPALVGERFLVATSSLDGHRVLAASDAKSGRPLWQRPLEDHMQLVRTR